MRFDYTHESETIFRKFLEVSLAIKKSSIEPTTLHLVDIRASQINGCAFCVDMHVKQANIAGEHELRLHHIAVWHESPLFTPRERAALAWTEALTKLSAHGISDELYESTREHFSEKEISDLTFAILTINGWNRMSIAARAVPGSQDEAYGLTKAQWS